MTVSARNTPNRLMLLPLVIGVMIGSWSQYVIPFMISGWTQAFGVSEGEIGFGISIRLAAFVLVCLLLASRVHVLDRRKLALLGAGVIVIACGATGFAPTAAVLLGARVLAGIGEGIVMTTVTSVAAEARNPEKTFSLIAFGMLGVLIVIYLGTPPMVEALGVSTTFLVLAGVTLLVSPVLGLLPAEKASDHSSARAKFPWTLASLGVLFAFIFLAIGSDAFWFYVERIGERNGMSMEEVGDALVLVSIIAFVGPIVAHQINTRFGRAKPIVCGFILLGVMAVAFTHLRSPVAFTVALGLSSGMLGFCQIFLLGLASSLDPMGRLAAAARGFLGIGGAIAPGLGGSILLLGGGYEAIGWAAFVASLLGAAVALPAAWSSVRGMSPDRPNAGS